MGTRPINDFLWLVGMAYRDGPIMYITNRLDKYRGLIITWRRPVETGSDGVMKLGVEETYPIHAADVERMVNDYRTRSPVIMQKSTGEIVECGPEYGTDVPGRRPEQNSATSAKEVRIM